MGGTTAAARCRRLASGRPPLSCMLYPCTAAGGQVSQRRRRLSRALLQHAEHATAGGALCSSSRLHGGGHGAGGAQLGAVVGRAHVARLLGVHLPVRPLSLQLLDPAQKLAACSRTDSAAHAQV